MSDSKRCLAGSGWSETRPPTYFRRRG